MPVYRRILTSRATWCAAAVILIAAAVFFTWVARHNPDPQQTIVLGQSSLFADSAAAFRILVRDHARSAPIPGAQVQVAIARRGTRENLGQFVTGADGSLSDTIHVPALAPGKYELIVESVSRVGKDRITRPIQIKQACRVYVTTDKPVYQPAQTIHMRALSLDEASLKPSAGRPILFEVTDAKGNKVCKTDLTTSPYGMAACDFTLAGEVNLGDYRIRVSTGGIECHRVVRVQQYVLPEFKITLTTDRPFYLGAEKVHGEVQARYFFGKPVAHADVTVTGRTLGARPENIFNVTGTTDPNGTFRFDAGLGEHFAREQAEESDLSEPRHRTAEQDNIPFQIEVVAKDGAGHEESAVERRTLARQAVDIHVFPEGGDLLKGIENVFYILTAYPTGQPAVCDVEVNGAGLHSDPMGVTIFKTQLDEAKLVLNIKARDAAGLTGDWIDEIPSWVPSNGLQLRTDKAVYRAGEKLVVTVLSSLRGNTFFLDVLRQGQTVLTRTLSANEMQAEIALELPSDLWGTLVLKAYAVQPHNRINMETRIVHVRRAGELRIETALDKNVYRPGDTAQAYFQVADSSGAPVPAALSLAAVDEAVFYVCENQPGVLDQFFLVDGRLPLSGYKMAFAISPAKLLSGDEQYQNLARALFSARGQAVGWGREYRSRRDDLDTQIYDVYRTIDRQDYTLQVESRVQKLAEAAAFRHRYLRVPLVVSAVVAGLMIPLGLLVVLARSIFRLFRRMADEEYDQVQRLTPGAVDRRVYVLAFAVLLPLVTYLAAAVLAWLLDSYGTRSRLSVDPRLLGGLVVVLSILATFGFPLVYRFGTTPFRQLGRAAFKVLSLPLLCIGLVYWVTYAAAGMIVGSFHGRDVYGFLSLAVLIALCVGLCWRAGVASRRPPGRFYTELGRSGRIVLVILLTQTLVLPIWVLLPSDGPGWRTSRHWRPTRAYDQGLTVDEDTRSGSLFYGDDDGMMGGMRMGGRASFGGMGGMAAPEAPASRYAFPAPPRVRRFFPETLLWQPQVITDETGRAAVEIPLADSITAWKMNVDSVSADGRLGNSVVDVRVFQDFFVDLDLPVALTRGDEISVPVLCHNYLPKPQTVALTLESASWYEVEGPAVQQVELGPNDVKSVAFRIKAKDVGTHELAVLAQGPSLSDAVRRSVEVRPDGVEVEDLQGGPLSASAQHTFHIPPESIPNSQKLLLKLYPSLFSEVMEGLDTIFKMPHGCFEQTSSTTYPNIMALLYLRRTGQATPEIEAKAKACIAAGYQKLLTFEVREGGFEWFGRAPAREKVTAYGIMELTDMAQVHDVDPAVIDRASRWLLGRQNRDGSWGDSDQGQTEPAQDSRARETAYIAWALTEAHVRDRRLDQSLEFLRQNVRETDSAYTLALATNALLGRDPNDGLGRKLLTSLQSRFRGDGRMAWINSAGTGALYSRGSCLDIETTALSALAMMKARAYADGVARALVWLCERKDRRGTWYSTQATVLAMKALIAGTRVGLESDAPTLIGVTVNETNAGSIEVTAQTRDLLHSLDLTAYLKPGLNTIHLTCAGGMELPYRLMGTHWAPQASVAAPARGEFEMDVRYDRDRLKVNDLLRCSVQVLYLGTASVNMVVMELGLPPGFAVERAAFDRLVDSGVFARYEMASDRVVLYVRSAAPKRRIRFSYELRALRPLRVQIPPAHVYEYYQPENRAQTGPHEIVVE